MTAPDQERTFVIEVDGQALSAHAGQTIAAVLMAAGRRTFRRTHGAHTPRGIFCGMGVCFECRVLVDGALEQRACVTLARPGMRVSLRAGDEVSDGTP